MQQFFAYNFPKVSGMKNLIIINELEIETDKKVGLKNLIP